MELTVNEWRIATKALVSIASGVGVECLLAETRADKAFLQDTNEITFSDEDMEVGYSDHKRYKRLNKPYSTWHVASNRNFRRKNSRMPNGGHRIWQKR